MAYSLDDVVPDGQLTGPRWLLHLIKVAQHATAAFFLWCFTAAFHAGGYPLIAALVGGPGIYAGILIKKLWQHRAEPLWAFIVDHLADWTNDGALATLTFAAGLIAAGYVLAGFALAVLCGAAWSLLHEKAVP